MRHANTLVLGANGFLGLNLVDALLAAGIRPRCSRRKRSNVLALRQRRAPMVLADLDAPESLEAAMEGCETVFHLAGHYPRLSLEPTRTLAVGVTQMDAVLDAAARAGVRRLVYVSSTATAAPAPEVRGHRRPSDERDVFAGPPGFGAYHDLKWAMEARALREDRFEVLVACPGACLGPWDLRAGTSALLLALARGLDPAHPDGVINPVDVRDVAQALLLLATHPSPPKRTLLCSANLRLHGLLAELAGRYGVPPPQLPLGDAAARAFADAEEQAVAASAGRPRLSREIVDLVVHGVPLDVRLSTTLGLRYRRLSETLDAADDWSRRMGLLPERSTTASTTISSATISSTTISSTTISSTTTSSSAQKASDR
jgi:dihydroflavonol-4-reductase